VLLLIGEPIRMALKGGQSLVVNTGATLEVMGVFKSGKCRYVSLATRVGAGISLEFELAIEAVGTRLRRIS